MVRRALQQRFPRAKAVGDGTGLSASRLPGQDIGRGIADHQGVRWRTVQCGEGRKYGVGGGLEAQTKATTLDMLEEGDEGEPPQDDLRLP